jgi:hypothetical protein
MPRIAKTIQIFLPDGDPRGIRVAEITTRIVRVIEVPRSLIEDFQKMPEAKQVGVYFLIGDMGDSETPLVYIGQSGDVGWRLTQQNKAKDFWNRALVAVSLTNSLTQTHALYLEWMSIKDAIGAGRYGVENGNAGNKPHTPAPLEADCLEIQETVSVLLATLGHPIFSPIVVTNNTPSGAKDDGLFYCKASGANGRGLYTEEGFVVLAGSTGRPDIVDSIKGTWHESVRTKLIASGVLENNSASVVFKKDHLFGSPSTAAIALTGRAANGWLEWRTEAGKTLNELKRQG